MPGRCQRCSAPGRHRQPRSLHLRCIHRPRQVRCLACMLRLRVHALEEVCDALACMVLRTCTLGSEPWSHACMRSHASHRCHDVCCAACCTIGIMMAAALKTLIHMQAQGLLGPSVARVVCCSGRGGGRARRGACDAMLGWRRGAAAAAAHHSGVMASSFMRQFGARCSQVTLGGGSAGATPIASTPASAHALPSRHRLQIAPCTPCAGGPHGPAARASQNNAPARPAGVLPQSTVHRLGSQQLAGGGSGFMTR